MKKEMKKILEILMEGSPAEVKEAKKKIEKLWSNQTKEFKENAPVVLNYIKKFDQIKSYKNQAAFASGLKMFYLSLSDDHFEELKDFTLKLIQYPNGHVRESIRKTSDWLYVSATARMDPSPFREEPVEADEVKKAKEQYFNYVREVESLIEEYQTQEYKNKKYIDELKPSVYKSLQLLWLDLTRGESIDLSEIPSEEILVKRKEIMEKAAQILKEFDSIFSFGDIVDMVYNEEDKDDFHKILSMFDRDQDAKDLQSILDVVSDIWNYFPHKSLNGKCPRQIVEEHNNKKY